MVSAAGVGRQQGTLMVAVPESLRAEVARSTGLMQEEAGAAGQPGYRGANWAFVYRYATVPFELTLSVEKVQPRITVDSLVEARLLPERLTVDVTAVYTIEKAGVFTLDWAIPPGYEDFEVGQVRGVAAGGATPVEVDAFHTESGADYHALSGRATRGKPARLVVNLSRKALGRVALAVQFHKELHEAALSAPAVKPAQIKVLVPTVPAASAQRATGRLVVFAPESLRVNPQRLTGLRSVSFTEAFEGIGAGAAPSGSSVRVRANRSRAGLRLRRRAGGIDPRGRAQEAGNDRAAIAGRGHRRRRGEVPAHALLQRALQRHQVAPARRAGGGGSQPARRHVRRARSGHFTPAEGPGPRRRGLEPGWRDGVSRRRRDRVEVGKEARQARRGQVGRVAGSLFEARATCSAPGDRSCWSNRRRSKFSQPASPNRCG